MFLYKMERGNNWMHINFILPFTCIIAGITCQPITSSMVLSSACSLMEKATCSSPIYQTSCVIGFTDFNVILSRTNFTDCKDIMHMLTGLKSALTDLRRTSDYIGITDKFDHEDSCISKRCGYYMTPDGTLSATLENDSPNNCTERDTFPRTTAGIVVMYLCGMLTGILVTSLVFVLYIRWLQTQSSKQDNTYLDLDLSGEGEDEEKPHERGQRGSVAFVREIASVYINQVGNEKDHASSTRSRLFSWSSPKSSKSLLDRKPSLNNKDQNNKKSTRQLYTFEQSVPEEIPDIIDLDSPTNPTEDLKYQNESRKCDSNRGGTLTSTTDDIQGSEEHNIQADGEWESTVESTVECDSVGESTSVD